MSMIRKVIFALVAVSALTVMAPGHAETPDINKEGQAVSRGGSMLDSTMSAVDKLIHKLTTPAIDAKQLECLARNIFYEAGGESEEGKVAVAMVTLNRVEDGRFGKDVCSVVKQRTYFSNVRTVTRQVKTLLGYRTEEQQVVDRWAVCQFSWACNSVANPRKTDPRWESSMEVARNLLTLGEYSDYKSKYSDALYFHATHVKPVWARQKQRVERIGGHIFYSDR